jgi:peptidyl-prolyl cis-trans isomerase SurA
MSPEPADAAEVADRQTQSSPLGLAGDTANKKNKKSTTTGEKTRLSDKNKKPAEQQTAPQGTDQTPQTPTPQATTPATPAPPQ